MTAFDLERALAGEVVSGHTRVEEAEDREYSEAEMFDNYVAFMQEVIPVAEEAGVKIALHPDDPPVPSLGGIARVFHKPENFKRALDAVPSPNHGLDFCMGCFSEMVYADQSNNDGVLEAIRYFGERGKISTCTSAMCKAACPNSRNAFPAKAI